MLTGEGAAADVTVTPMLTQRTAARSPRLAAGEWDSGFFRGLAHPGCKEIAALRLTSRSSAERIEGDLLGIYKSAKSLRLKLRIAKLLKDNGFIMNFIARAVNECHYGVGTDSLEKRREGGIVLQLESVTRAEFIPARRDVGMKPLAQLGGRGEVFFPQLAIDPLMGKTAGPETVHKYTVTVAFGGSLIGSFGFDYSHI